MMYLYIIQIDISTYNSYYKVDKSYEFDYQAEEGLLTLYSIFFKYQIMILHLVIIIEIN